MCETVRPQTEVTKEEKLGLGEKEGGSPPDLTAGGRRVAQKNQADELLETECLRWPSALW